MSVAAEIARNLRYVEQLESHMDEDGATSPRNLRDVIAMVKRGAEALALCESNVAALERANSTRPDYDLRCQECGRAHILDTSIPSEIWNQIADPSDILCTLCIDRRMADKGLASAEAEFYFVGRALTSKLYAESHGCVAAAERRAQEAEAKIAALTSSEPDMRPIADMLSEFLRDKVRELLTHCNAQEVAGFHRIFKDGIEDLEPVILRHAILLCQRTIARPSAQRSGDGA